MEKLIKYTDFDDDDNSFDGDDGDGDEMDDEFVEKISPVDDDDAAHEELLEAIGTTFGTKLRRREELRSEAGQKVSEFQVIANDDRRSTPGFRGVSNLKKMKKEKKKKDNKNKSKKQIAEEELMEELDYDDTTMTKPVMEKAKRSALYENAKKDVSKWNSVVYHNRVADQLVFPMNNGEKVAKRSIKDTVSEFVPRTPLEEEMAKILYGEEFVKRKKDELHAKNVDEKTEEESYMLSIEEALEKHNELSRLRAIQSYEMAKAKRRNKIKSKRYHRLLKREKIKKQLKEFEDLKEKDPEGALEKLKELETARIKERMTLKHRNTSKWAKSQATRAKYSKESRIALSEQLKISKELTEKQMDSSEESSDDDDDDGIEFMEESSKKNKDDIQDLNVNATDREINFETIPGKAPVAHRSFNLVSVRDNTSSTPGASSKLVLLDPKNYLVINSSKKTKSVTKHITIDKEFLQANDDDEVEELSEEGGDGDDQRAIIAEAFEDDDVVADFRKQKQDEIEAAKPKDLDLSLPGWGDWGGKGISLKKKRRKFVLKAPPPPPRKDAKLSHVILNDDANKKLRDHQVREVPFPFSRVKDFEKIIRAPVGRTWLPEKAMKNLIAPKVITKLGSVIKPIDEQLLVKNKHVTEKDSLKLLGAIKLLK